MTRSALLLSWALMVACAASSSSEGPSEGPSVGAAARARALEGRLMAPCCWAQTLDVHESEVTPTLRAEILRRVSAGEPVEAIEDDFVARYGDRVLAVPRGGMSSEVASAPVVLFFLVGSALLIASLVRRRALVPAPAAPAAARDEMDRRLDDELERLDEP